jgi:putative transposase
MHHTMNRGHDGTDIFCGNKNKNQFIDYLAESSTKLKIKIFAYCVMDTHYHLVLENSNGKMSEFMKRLNGHYGSYYPITAWYPGERDMYFKKGLNPL